MTKRFSSPQLVVSRRLTTLAQTTFGAAFAFGVAPWAIALNLWINPSLAGDPFRNSKPHQIGDPNRSSF
jgi:hypothetical protein